MRVKAVPVPPESIEELEAIRKAAPLVPEPEERCRDRLASRMEIDPEDARDWLVFLRGMGLVAEGRSGFYRTREGPDDMGKVLRLDVYGAREVEEVLSDEPLSSEEVFERFDAIPRWERFHHRNPEGVWRERVERLAEWLVLLDRAARVEEGYVSHKTER